MKRRFVFGDYFALAVRDWQIDLPAGLDENAPFALGRQINPPVLIFSAVVIRNGDARLLFGRIVARQDSRLDQRVAEHKHATHRGHGLVAEASERRADPESLLRTLGLTEKRNAAFSRLSGGQKQRLFIALALVNDPELVFLDELTTGLDPHARRSMWDLVRDIRAHGKTVFLTTHYMEEAEQLCDRVLVIHRGQIVALDTPENLVGGLAEETRILFTADRAFDLRVLKDLSGVVAVERSGDRVTVTGQGDRLVWLVVNALDAQGVKFRSLRTEQPNLEDVFLTLTDEEAGS